MRTLFRKFRKTSDAKQNNRWKWCIRIVMIILLAVLLIQLFISRCTDCNPIGDPQTSGVNGTVYESGGFGDRLAPALQEALAFGMEVKTASPDRPDETQAGETAEDAGAALASTEILEKQSFTGYAQIYCPVYERPDLQAHIAGYFYYGDLAAFFETSDPRYWAVSYGNRTGYVRKEYITEQEPVPPEFLYNTFRREDLPEKTEAVSACLEDFPVILQNPGLPSGCEVTALAMVLNYRGYSVTNADLADNFLPYGQKGDNIFTGFIGSVYDDSSYGCYADAICRCAAAYASNERVANISGADLEDLCGYVASGYPVIVWATESMQESGIGSLWAYEGLPMGYLKNEHCLVLIGYEKDTDTAIFADPLQGEERYSLKEFYQRYRSQYMQAVLLY